MLLLHSIKLKVYNACKRNVVVPFCKPTVLRSDYNDDDYDDDYNDDDNDDDNYGIDDNNVVCYTYLNVFLRGYCFIFQGTAMFLHWLVGMVYVFYFASFVLLLREVLRPGVLWFLRNLNDPDFHPVQEVRKSFKHQVYLELSICLEFHLEQVLRCGKCQI